MSCACYNSDNGILDTDTTTIRFITDYAEHACYHYQVVMHLLSFVVFDQLGQASMSYPSAFFKTGWFGDIKLGETIQFSLMYCTWKVSVQVKVQTKWWCQIWVHVWYAEVWLSTGSITPLWDYLEEVTTEGTGTRHKHVKQKYAHENKYAWWITASRQTVLATQDSRLAEWTQLHRSICRSFGPRILAHAWPLALLCDVQQFLFKQDGQLDKHDWLYRHICYSNR